MSDEHLDMDININTTDIDKVEEGFKKVGTQIQTAIDKLGDFESIINKISNANINVKNLFNGNSHTIIGANGTAYSGLSTREQGFKNAQQAYLDMQQQEMAVMQQRIETEKEIARLRAEQAKVVKQNADTAATNAQARLKTAEYRGSNAHLGYEASLTRKNQDLAGFYRYKSAHPEEFTNMGVRSSGRYQAGKFVDSISSQFSKNGLSGRVISDLGGILSATLMTGPMGWMTETLKKMTVAIKDLSSAAEASYENLESLKTQLSVVFGGYTQSAQMYTDITQYATKSPFGIEQTTELATLLRQSGVEATKVMDTLKMLGDTATGNMEKMKRIANNYAQIVSIGKASMLDMRQFAYAGIPIFEAISNELGVSQTKLRKLISDGKVTAEIVEKVFKDMTGVNGIFEKATEKGAKTLKARKQNLEDIKTIAKAGIGENLARIGDNPTRGLFNFLTNGQSFRMWKLSLAEDFYEKIGDNATFKNILHSVRNIEYATEDLPALEKKRDKLASRPIASLTPDELKKLNELNEKIERGRAITEDMDYVRSNQTAFYKALIDGVGDDWLKSVLTPYFTENGIYYNDTISAMDNATPEMLKKIFPNIDNLRLSYDESRVMNLQQNLSDSISEERKKSGSYASAAQELLTEYENTEKYKQKEEEERKKRLTSIYNELKEVSKNTKKGNVIDFNNTSYKQLENLINKGAISESVALNVVRSNKNEFKKDFSLLYSQSTTRSAEARRYLSTVSSEDIGDLATLLDKFDETLKGGTFGRAVREGGNSAAIKLFNTVWGQINDSVEATIKDAGTSENKKKIATEFRNILAQSLLKYTAVDVDGIDFAELFKTGKGDDVAVPLWKRILGNGLGISPTAVTGTDQALSFWSENLAPRKLAGNVIGTALKNDALSMDEVRRILGSQRGKSILKFSNSNDETWQIDWQKVRQDTERFALSLRNSTKVVTAFKTSLEEEKNTLVDLLTSSFTTYETDGKVARVVSAKTYEKLLKDDDDIGVNAFGEKLYNINGEEVDYIKDGIAYDKNGVALQEQQLKVSGKIYNEIEKRLAEINKKLSEATSAENLRKILDAEAQRANDGRITYAVSRNLNSEQAAYVYRNADIVNKEFQNVAKRALEIEMLDESSYDTFNEFNDALARGENEARALAAIFADEVRKILFGTSGIYSEDVVREANQRTDESRRKEFADNFKNTLLGEGELFTGGSNNYSAGRILEALGFSRDTNLSSLMSELGDTQVNELLDKFEIKATTAEERLNGLTQALAKDFLEKQMKELSKQASDLVFDTLWEGWQSPFKTMGDDLLFLIDKTKTWSDVWDDLGSSMQTIAGNLVSQTGQLAQNAGLALVQSGAMQQNYGMIVGGLALAAAGGFASSFGNAIANYNKNNSDKDKESKLQSITDQIKNLLEQARKDALYYEKNLQHRTALGINEKFSYTSVNDAVITPKGQVIKTNPSDYLIATKTPQTLGGTVVQPNISFNVIDNVGVKVKTEQKVNADGSIELQAILLNVMDDYISSSKSDEAFTARQYRLQGHTSIM